MKFLWMLSYKSWPKTMSHSINKAITKNAWMCTGKLHHKMKKDSRLVSAPLVRRTRVSADVARQLTTRQMTESMPAAPTDAGTIVMRVFLAAKGVKWFCIVLKNVKSSIGQFTRSPVRKWQNSARTKRPLAI